MNEPLFTIKQFKLGPRYSAPSVSSHSLSGNSHPSVLTLSFLSVRRECALVCFSHCCQNVRMPWVAYPYCSVTLGWSQSLLLLSQLGLLSQAVQHKAFGKGIGSVREDRSLCRLVMNLARENALRAFCWIVRCSMSWGGKR